MAAKLEGTCHCGNIAIVLETGQDPRSLPLRACDCSFCRKHGARTTSDPEGRAWAVLNVNLFRDAASAFDRPAHSMSYEGETREERIARRKRVWTPVEL